MKRMHNKSFIGFVVIFSLLLFHQLYTNFYRSHSINKGTIISNAIIFNKRHMTNSGNIIEVKFSVNSDTIKAKLINPNKCYGAINEGSVMLIRYAKEDPKVVEILACHYNERKHKHLIGLDYSDELEIEE